VIYRGIALTAWSEKRRGRSVWLKQAPKSAPRNILSMMHTGSNLTGNVVPVNEGMPANESGATLLAWMGELEASLKVSHEALLKLDLARIEYRTSEQASLMGKLDAVRKQSEDGALGLAAHAPGPARELRACGTRILEAARLQSALLARAQGKLRVLGNMLAGPGADYGPLLARQPAGRGRWGWRVTL